MSFVAGETVGTYRVTEQLGSGGMATVFKAYHAALDRYVALKVLHPAFKEDPNFLARFQREARVVARLEHPNIVPVYDFSDHKGQPYLVMRYIEGETLKARMARGALTLDETLKVVHRVGAALIYAHGQGVLHRDIKPSNVMLTPKDEVFLADFGLARIAQAGESTLSQDSILGTPQYISPEQAKGERDLDARTDIYSLGVVIYELLVGRVPYQADTPFAVVHDHIFTPLPMPRSLNPNLPESLERFLLKALTKDRADRFASIEEMMAGLNRAVDEAGIQLLGSTVLTAGAASTLAAGAKPSSTQKVGAASTTVAPARKPISPLVWIGLGAVIVIAIIAVILLTRPRSIPAPPLEPSSQPGTPFRPEPNQAALALEEANNLFGQANEQVVQARVDLARDTFTHAAEVAEHGLSVLTTRGTPEETELKIIASESWLASGHSDRAEPHLEWLVSTLEDKSKPLAGLALAYLLQDRVGDSLVKSDEALRHNPDAPEAHAVKGCALRKDGKPLEAAREFRQAQANADGPSVLPPWLTLVLDGLDCRPER